MAKFKSKGSALLVNHFGESQAKVLESLFVSLLSDKGQIGRDDFLRAMCRGGRMSTREASALVTKLIKASWLEYSSEWSDNITFGPLLWVNFVEHLTDSSVTQLSQVRFSARRHGDFIPDREYAAWVALTHAVLNQYEPNPGVFEAFGERLDNYWSSKTLLNTMGDLFEWQMMDNRHVDVIRRLPKSLSAIFVNRLLETKPLSDFIDHKIPERQLALYREFAPGAVGLQCYGFFYELWHEGVAVAKSHAVPFNVYYDLITAVELILRKEYKGALQCAREGLKRAEAKTAFNDFWMNWVYGLCLYYNKDNGVARRTMTSLVKHLDHRELHTVGLLLWCSLALSEDLSNIEDQWNFASYVGEQRMPLTMLGMMLRKYSNPTAILGHWVERALKDSTFDGVLKLEALITVKGDEAEIKALSEKLGMTSIMPPATDIVEPWERLLDKLLLAEGQTKSTDSKERVIYLVDTETWDVRPRLLKSKDGKTWSKGRDIALKTFAQGDAEGLSAQDKAVARAVKQYQYGRTIEYYMDKSVAWQALIGHPYVYNDNDPTQRIEVRERPLTLSVKETPQGYVLSDNIKAGDKRLEDAVVSYNGTDVFVCPINARSGEILSDLLGQKTFPLAAKKKLTTLLGRLANRMTVMSDLTSEAVKTIKANVNPFFRFDQLMPGEFTVTMGLHPIPGSALICEPGVGPENLSANQKGKRVAVQRQLKDERTVMNRVLEHLQTYKLGTPEDGTWSVSTSGCLTFLEALHEVKNDVVIEWSDHVDYRVNHSKIQAHQCSVSVRRLGQWFEVEGMVEVSSTLKMTLREVLEKLRASKVPGYIELSEGEFVALTDQLRQQLMMMEGLLQQTKKSLALPRYAVNVIDDLTEVGVNVTADEATNEMIERIRKVSLSTEALPTQLTADLRDYQVDGFRWMSRLAHWGAGGILADDMGLGKTVQTITLLLSRAAEGPSLVVLPTSVLLNWQAELRRFAPSLRVINYNLEGRESALEALSAGDVVLSTYGVMSNDIEHLQKIDWNVVVLDEAHTIKSKETKTSKAAMMLNAQCRLLLTGTPLQNHLGELWNLLEFANPGYLGTYNSFVERFVMPIERDHNKEKQRQLKRMISPFILRRTKTDVLDELPEKTDITVRIELSDDEKALYEHIREKTVEELESGEINPMQALAALTRLRQAACHPKLVNPQLTFDSSKTQAFLKLVEELHNNGHRALVFSQFTSHLALVREALDALNIEYLYLDGAVSAAQRTKLTETFRLGKMPLFLISLKAGGTGLNLTAADYVIHLDPWWNPAIEDQASDRAYRIGQERPVTVYRLVAEGTIEEKILRLHETKRSLADALLEGADMSSRLSKDALLALLSSKEGV